MITRVLNQDVEYGPIAGCWLIYGPPDSGKTYSALTCPMPMALINSESKDPRVTLGEEARDRDITVLENASFYEIMEWLHGQVNKPEYKCVMFDGLTVGMSNYRSYLADDRAEIRWKKMTDKEKAEAGGELKLARDRFTLDQSDWGIMAEMMLRQTKLMNTLSKRGVMVIATAISQESPRWDRTIGVGPALLGRDYPAQIHGLFDFIAYITKPWGIDEDGNVYPPKVSFHAPNGEYMARASGRLSRFRGAGPLNYTKLLEIINKKDGIPNDHTQGN
jgi:hypothetical protein